MPQKYFQFPFSVTGNHTTIPNDTQPSGSVSYAEGFGPDYQLNPESDPDALVIPRDQFNQLMLDITQSLQYLQQHGTPEFITSADNGGSPYSYSEFDRVRFDDGGGFKVYESLIGSNTTDPTNATNWAQVPSPNNIAGIPIGATIPYAGSTAPDGWLFCYGQALSRSTYAALFAIIGTSFGAGNGTTTFNVPDLRGRVAVGRDNMGGVAAGLITTGTGNSGISGTQLGASGGNQQVQSHTHGVTDPGHNHDANCTYGAAGLNPSGAAVSYSTSGPPRVVTKDSNTGISIQNYGGGGSGNVQPSLITNYIIKI